MSAQVVSKEMEDLTKKWIKELEPVAKKIIKIIADADLPMGELHAHDNAKFDGVAKEILAVMLADNVRYTDRFFLFQLVLQPFDFIKETAIKSLHDSFNRAVDKSFGKDIEEFRLADLDKVLKA